MHMHELRFSCELADQSSHHFELLAGSLQNPWHDSELEPGQDRDHVFYSWPRTEKFPKTLVWSFFQEALSSHRGYGILPNSHCWRLQTSWRRSSSLRRIETGNPQAHWNCASNLHNIPQTPLSEQDYSVEEEGGIVQMPSSQQAFVRYGFLGH